MSDFDKDFEDVIDKAGGIDAYLRKHDMDPEKLAKESKVLAEVCMSNRLKDMQIEKLATWLNMQPLIPHGLDSFQYSLTDDERDARDYAKKVVLDNVNDNAQKRPMMTTLLEEVAEAILACRGKHDDSLLLELTQIAGTATNLMWQVAMYGTDKVNNLKTFRGKNYK